MNQNPFAYGILLGASTMALGVTLAVKGASQPRIGVEAGAKQICEAEWQKESQREACFHRVMAAIGDDERLRSNELRRALVKCEKDLKDAAKKPMP